MVNSEGGGWGGVRNNRESRGAFWYGSCILSGKWGGYGEAQEWGTSFLRVEHRRASQALFDGGLGPL